MKNFLHGFFWLLVSVGVLTAGFFALWRLDKNTDIQNTKIVELQVLERGEAGKNVIESEIIVIDENETMGADKEDSAEANRDVEIWAQDDEDEITDTQNAISEEAQHLIEKLEKIKNDGVVMRRGSRGTRVGVLQEFLNIYSGEDKKIDNDFGPTTEKMLKEFQSENGLKADGVAGQNVYSKAIEWLMANG